MGVNCKKENKMPNKYFIKLYLKRVYKMTPEGYFRAIRQQFLYFPVLLQDQHHTASGKIN